ncbi:hypothetical protein [Muricoccus radiodurans]|uniref:hypothetical protein n=1 Tax=Muricoccus radiodurans TaxID=2231721 RepID=UPI003CE69630
MSGSEMQSEVNFEALGRLVKTWVLGEDRLKIPDPANPDANLSWPRPASTTDSATINALREQFARAGTLFTIPETVTEVKVVESSDTCFVLKLPSPQRIRDFEERLKKPGYPVPTFYASAVCGTPPTTMEEKLRLDAARIGDHTISNCAG